MGLVAGRYRYLSDVLYLDSCVPVTRPYAWLWGPSPLVVEAFALRLRAHPDREFVKYVLQGLSFGFRIGFIHCSHRL